MNLNQRFPLRDDDRPTMRNDSQPDDQDRERAGCSAFLPVFAVLICTGVFWLIGF